MSHGRASRNHGRRKGSVAPGLLHEEGRPLGVFGNLHFERRGADAVGFVSAHDPAVVPAGNVVGRERDRVRGRIDGDEERARAVRAVGGGAVEQAGVHETDRARGAGAGDGLPGNRRGLVVRHRAREHPVMPQAQERPLVGAGHDFEGAVLFGHLVQHQERQ